jgi:hypothetical protein
LHVDACSVPQPGWVNAALRPRLRSHGSPARRSHWPAAEGHGTVHQATCRCRRSARAAAAGTPPFAAVGFQAAGEPVRSASREPVFTLPRLHRRFGPRRRGSINWIAGRQEPASNRSSLGRLSKGATRPPPVVVRFRLSSVAHRRVLAFMPVSAMNVRSPSNLCVPATLWRQTNLHFHRCQPRRRVSRWGAASTAQTQVAHPTATTCKKGRSSMGALASREPDSRLARAPLRRASA